MFRRIGQEHAMDDEANSDFEAFDSGNAMTVGPTTRTSLQIPDIC